MNDYKISLRDIYVRQEAQRRIDSALVAVRPPERRAVLEQIIAAARIALAREKQLKKKAA